MESKEIEYIKSLVNQNRAVSFDVFDTLVLRPFLYPTDVFLYIEQTYDAPNFRYERQKAERIAHYYNPTATFAEIYRYMPDELQHLAQIELDLELQTIQPNKAMKVVFDYVRKQKKKIIITSDMYLPKEFIARILKKNGYTGYDKLIVSCEHGESKATGKLFKSVIKAAGIPAGQILHIGDSVHHDVEMPKEYGLNSYHYWRVSERFFANPDNTRIKAFYDENWNRAEASIIVGMLILKWFDDESDYNVRDYWEEFGYNIGGPLCWSFVNSAIEFAQRKGLSDLFFIARDGYPLYEVFNILKRKFPVKGHYVYSNRYLYAINTAEYLNECHLDAILLYFKKFIPELDLDISFLKYQEKEELFNKYEKKVKNLAAKNFKKYCDYINKMNIGSGIGIVDSGAGFYSSQKLIEHALKDKKIYGLYLQSSENYECRYESLYHKNLLWLPPEKFHGIFMVIELLLTSPENPVIGIQNGQPVYQQKINDVEACRAQISEKIIRGEKNFAQDLQNVFGDFNVNIQPATLFSLLRHYLCNLSTQDAGYFSAVLYDSCTITHSGKYISLYSTLCPGEKISCLSKTQKLQARLLSFIPFFEIVMSEAKTIWKLFNISLLKKKYKGNEVYISILGIPGLKIKSKDKNEKSIRKISLWHVPFMKIIKKLGTLKLSVLGIPLVKVRKTAVKNTGKNIKISKNTFILWSASPVFHSEVDPGYAKYLVDLGYNVLVLRTYNRIQNSIWKDIKLPKIKVVNLSQREIYNFLNSEKTVKNKNIKGILVTTSLFFYTYGIGEKQWVNRDVHNDLSNIARTFDIPTPAELSLLKNKYGIFLEVAHNLDLQPLSSVTEQTITLFRPNYHHKKTVVVNPHYFGRIQTRHPKNKVTTFISVGGVGKDRKNVDALWNAVRNLIKSGKTAFQIQIFTYARDLKIPAELKPFIKLYVGADYPKIFRAMEKADYFLALLDGTNPVHDCYITTRTSGSFQLCYGFRTPMIIEEKFAEYYSMDKNNAVLYDRAENLSSAMMQAIEQTPEQYRQLRKGVDAMVKRIEDLSLQNFAGLLQNKAKESHD